MSRYAHFPNIKSGVAFTDPWYGEDVWCQYRKEFQDSNWFMKLDASKGPHGSVDITAVFGCPVVAGRVDVTKDAEGFAFNHPAHYRDEHVQLGIDTAQIFFGSYAEFKDYGEAGAFNTGGDGLCGDLIVFTVKGEDKPSGFIISCSFVEEFVNAEEVFQQLLSSFEGKEISREAFLAGVDPKALCNKILLSNELRIADKASHKGGPAPEREPNSQNR